MNLNAILHATIVKCTLVDALVKPILCHGCEVWSNLTWVMGRKHCNNYLCIQHQQMRLPWDIL